MRNGRGRAVAHGFGKKRGLTRFVINEAGLGRRGDFAGRRHCVSAPFADDAAGGARFAGGGRAARRAFPVNVIDKPAFCDFSFGSIVNRSPLVIGISTDGARARVFAQSDPRQARGPDPRLGFRALGKTQRGAGVGAVQTLRPVVFRARRRFWQVFTRRPWNPSRTHEPAAADFDACMALTREGSARRQSMAR